MTPSPAPKPKRESGLPLLGLILSGVGLMFPPLLLPGLVIGVVALVQKKGSQLQAVLAVGIPLLAAMIFGILIVVALPKYRAQLAETEAGVSQQECRQNLQSALAAERSYFAEHQQFDPNPAVLGFAPERGNRYLYLFAASGHVPPNTGAPLADAVGVGVDPALGSNAAVEAALPVALRSRAGVQGSCPDCAITILCAGNLDPDPALDVWTISSGDRPGIPAGELHQESSDLAE